VRAKTRVEIENEAASNEEPVLHLSMEVPMTVTCPKMCLCRVVRSHICRGHSRRTCSTEGTAHAPCYYPTSYVHACFHLPPSAPHVLEHHTRALVLAAALTPLAPPPSTLYPPAGRGLGCRARAGAPTAAGLQPASPL